ncbi:MAG: hypothetical protein ACKVOI_16705 [Dongiaceae bacterium]
MILTLAMIPSAIMIPILIAVFTGIGLAASPDRSFVPLWKHSPTAWRILSCIFVVLVPVLLPPRGELLIVRALLGMLALSGVILLLSVAHAIFGERFGLYDSDD